MPTRNVGILPAAACLKTVTTETDSRPASSFAVIARPIFSILSARDTVDQYLPTSERVRPTPASSTPRSTARVTRGEQNTKMLPIIRVRVGDLPVLVHVVSQRARVLRLRRTDNPLAISVVAVLPSSLPERSRHPVPSAFRSSIARPTDTPVYASSGTSRCHLQDSRPGWIRCSPFL